MKSMKKNYSKILIYALLKTQWFKAECINLTA